MSKIKMSFQPEINTDLNKEYGFKRKFYYLITKIKIN